MSKIFSGSFLFSRSSNKNNSSPQVSPFSNGKTLPTNVHGASGGVVPPILLEENRVPKFYKDCLAQCGAISSNQLPNTGLVYNLMVASQLPKDILSNIWTMVNRSVPGQLTRQEFFSCLALIALAQKGESISALCDVNTLPIPHLQTFTTGGVGKTSQKQQNGTKAMVDTANLPMQTKTAPIQSTKKDVRDNILHLKKTNNEANFIPTDLVDNGAKKQNTPAENGLDDLLGDLCLSAPAPSSIVEPKNDLTFDILNLDLSNNATHQEKMKPIVDDDPYAVLRNEPQEDEYLVSWQKIVDESSKVILNAIELLQKEPNLTVEILKVEKGCKFVLAIRAMTKMLNRVALSIHKYRPSETKIIEKARNCLILWTQFIKENGAVEMVLQTRIDNGNFIGLKQLTTCNLCLQQITADDPLHLELSQFSYHSSCANFWVNHVDLGLPQLDPYKATI
uniref:EH domain-containing protein n=1 Tax=Panagrolaimus sp. JU765 TaxID=591449 RepID=A0AC34RF12_9BILA